MSKKPPLPLTSVPVRAALVERAAGGRVLVVEEVQQRVVAVVADVGIRRQAPDAGLVKPVADVLIDLPADPGRLQPLRVGLPAVPELVVGDHRPAALAVVAVPAGPHVVAVGVGRAEHRAVVAVADGERVGQRVVERQVRALHVRHGRGGLGRYPLVPVAAVEHLVRPVPAVVEILDEGERQVARTSGRNGEHDGRSRRPGTRPACRWEASPDADRRTRALRASRRSSDRTTGSPASAPRCARHPSASESPRFAGIASARAMLSDSIVAATLPPASWRNLRRLTARISITSLIHGQPLTRCPPLTRSLPARSSAGSPSAGG